MSTGEIMRESEPIMKEAGIAISDSEAMDKLRQHKLMQVNVYLYTDCHKKFLRASGYNHAFLKIELQENYELVSKCIKGYISLVIPTRGTSIRLTPDSIRTMKEEQYEVKENGKTVNKTKLRLDNVNIEGEGMCTIYLSECNDKQRIMNDVKCLSSLSARDIGLFLTNALILIDDEYKRCNAIQKEINEEAEAMAQSAMDAANKKREDEVNRQLPPAPTHPVTRTGGKSRKNKKSNKSKGKTHKRKNNKKSKKRNHKKKRHTRKSHK